MKTTHKTTTGETILIVEMEDSHLINTLNIFCRQISQYRDALDNPKTFKKSEEVLYGRDRLGDNEASNKLVSLTDKILPYVLESSIRGLEISKLLQDAYGRTKTVESKPIDKMY